LKTKVGSLNIIVNLVMKIW